MNDRREPLEKQCGQIYWSTRTTTCKRVHPTFLCLCLLHYIFQQHFCQWEQALCRFIWGSLRLHHFIRLCHLPDAMGQIFTCSCWKDNLLVQRKPCLRLWQKWWLILDGKLGAIRKGACLELQLIWFVWVKHHHTAAPQEAFPSWSICASPCNILPVSCSSRAQRLMCFWKDSEIWLKFWSAVCYWLWIILLWGVFLVHLQVLKRNAVNLNNAALCNHSTDGFSLSQSPTLS